MDLGILLGTLMFVFAHEEGGARTTDKPVEISKSLCVEKSQLGPLRAAAAEGNLLAARRLVRHYGSCEDNANLELRYLQQAASYGFGMDLYNLGMYWELEGESAGAIGNFKAAAARAHSPAMMRLGRAYAKGELGLDKDVDRAVDWFESALRAGVTVAVFELADIALALPDSTDRVRALSLLIAVRDKTDQKFGAWGWEKLVKLEATLSPREVQLANEIANEVSETAFE